MKTHPQAGDGGDFAAKYYQNTRGQRMGYQLFIPKEYKSGRRYPLVLWLHGGAGRRNDNLKQISGSNAIGSHIWTLPENQTRNPCFVVAPQCPDREEWATIEKRNRRRDCNSRWRWWRRYAELLALMRGDFTSQGNPWVSLELGLRNLGCNYAPARSVCRSDSSLRWWQ